MRSILYDLFKQIGFGYIYDFLIDALNKINNTFDYRWVIQHLNNMILNGLMDHRHLLLSKTKANLIFYIDFSS